MSNVRSKVHTNVEEIYSTISTWLSTRSDGTNMVLSVETRTDIADDVERACRDASMELVRVGVGYAPVDLTFVCASPIAVTFKRKVVIVYHYDAIVASDVGMSSSINAAAKSNVVPMILMGTEVKLSLKNIEKIEVIDPLAPKPVNRTKGIDGASAALLGQQTDFSGDNMAFGGVFDNYLSNRPEIDDASTIAESFSVSERMSESLCRSGVFNNDPYTFVPLQTASLVFREMHNRGCALSGRVKTFGQVWSKTNSMYAKLGVQKKVCRALARATGSGCVADVYGIQMMFVQALKANEITRAAKIVHDVGLTAVDVNNMMRLSLHPYPASLHAKVKAELHNLPSLSHK